MYPIFMLKLEVNVPKESFAFASIVQRMQQAIRNLSEDAVTYARGEAPGDKLKYDIDYTIQLTPQGAISTIWMPYQLKFTLPPGTRPHFIPGGRSVSTIQEAADLQAKKGYPLRFYWEHGPYGPGIYFFWSVRHPGWQYGGDWGDRVVKYLSIAIDDEVQQIWDFVANMWGADATVMAGVGKVHEQSIRLQ